MPINLGDKNAELLGLETSDAAMELIEERQALVKKAREVLDKINSDVSDAEMRKLEKQHDGLMARFEEIDAKLAREEGFSIRAAIGRREIRSGQGGGNRFRDNVDMRPNPGDGEVRGQDVGDLEFRSDEPGETIALRSNQSFASYVIERRGNNADRSLGGLSTGAYLRSMVVGPKNELEKRALAEGADSAGGFTVPDVLSARLIDRMRASSVVFRAGAQIVPLLSDVSYIAKIASDPVPAWRLENDPVNESDPTFSRVTFNARSLITMVKISRELLEDSLNIETALPDLLATALGQELDRVALLGSGNAPEPRGVANFAALTPNGFVGGDLTGYGPLIRARTALRTANSDVSAYIMSPRDEGQLAGLTATDGQPINVPAAIANVPMLTTSKVPIDLGTGGDESIILAGDWRRLMVGVRSSIRVEILRERFAENHQYAFVAHLRADVAAEHEAAFTKLGGVSVPAP